MYILNVIPLPIGKPDSRSLRDWASGPIAAGSQAVSVTCVVPPVCVVTITLAPWTFASDSLAIAPDWEEVARSSAPWGVSQYSSVVRKASVAPKRLMRISQKVELTISGSGSATLRVIA